MTCAKIQPQGILGSEKIFKGFYDDDDEFRFNDASTHEGHLRQNG